MRRVHNTAKRKILLDFEYPTNDKKSIKPHGFWYSLNDEWKEWCTTEMPHWIFPNNFELDIDMSKILLIQSTIDIIAFQKKYVIEGHHQYDSFIDWGTVKKDYKGIEIQKYYHIKYMLGYNFPIWFYGWDVSSGCIWDLSIIKNIKKIKACS